jgi:alanine dehydrogenase
VIVGVPKELKQGEFRVALTPAGAEVLVAAGHRVLVERGAGEHAGFPDREYRKTRAQLVRSAAQAWGADLVVKVKEPLSEEFRHFRAGQILFTFLHLAPNATLVSALLKRRVTAIGYETVEEGGGKLPILEPMSEIAGRVAALMGAYYQANPQGGRGMLFGGMPGVLPAHVVVLGGGTVGENAARVAAGMGSRVTILERRSDRMRYLGEIMPQVATLMADPANIRSAVSSADILIGAVHVPGSRTPQLVTRAMVKKMQPRSVIIDVAIDQGGSCETSRPTSHFKPTYLAEGVLHYCVPNMPGAYGRTSTLALTNATLGYVQTIAKLGARGLLKESRALLKGLQCHRGLLVCRPVAEAQNRPYSAPEKVIHDA